MAPPAANAARPAAQPGFAGLPTPARLFLGVMIVAAMGATYYFALHVPLTEEVDAARARQNQLEADRAAAVARQQEFIALRDELAGREGLDRRNLRVLPEAAEMPAFLQDLNRLSELSGLSMRLVEPQPEVPEEHYVKLPVRLRVSGRYHQLARFFYNVSRLERAISMENLDLSEPVVEGDETVLTVEVLATTFRRPTVEAPPAGEGG